MSGGDIHVRLAGGVGNQLFQIFAAFMMARQEVPPRRIALFCGDLGAYDVARLPFLKNETVWAGVTILPSNKPLPKFLQRVLRLIERLGFHSLHQAAMAECHLVSGYCQEPTFSGRSAVVVQEFRRALRSHLTENFPQFALAPRVECVIHIRGGDALLPENRRRYALPVSYYEDAFRVVSGSPDVFSDDPIYAKSVMAIAASPNCAYLESSQGEHYLAHAMDAEMMVLSRSTLSFWAGFLSDATRTYVPRTYPAAWVKLLELTGKSVIPLDDQRKSDRD